MGDASTGAGGDSRRCVPCDAGRALNNVPASLDARPARPSPENDQKNRKYRVPGFLPVSQMSEIRYGG